VRSPKSQERNPIRRGRYASSSVTRPGGAGDTRRDLRHPHRHLPQSVSNMSKADGTGYAEVDYSYTFKDIRDKGRQSLPVRGHGGTSANQRDSRQALSRVPRACSLQGENLSKLQILPRLAPIRGHRTNEFSAACSSNFCTHRISYCSNACPSSARFRHITTRGKHRS
jgi:hypothetical protein